MCLMATNQNQLSQKARENLDELKAWRDEPTLSAGQFLKMQSGQTKILLFDLDDMHVETVTFPDKPDKKVRRAKYGVFDVSEKSYDKQYLSGGKNLSLAVDSNLEEGNTVLKITKTGEMYETRYSVVATQLPADYHLKS
jgi:hypothetical protein